MQYIEKFKEEIELILKSIESEGNRRVLLGIEIMMSSAQYNIDEARRFLASHRLDRAATHTVTASSYVFGLFDPQHILVKETVSNLADGVVPRQYFINVRSWFDKFNTYHSVCIQWKEGVRTRSIVVPYEKGFGTHWHTTVCNALKEFGIENKGVYDGFIRKQVIFDEVAVCRRSYLHNQGRGKPTIE